MHAGTHILAINGQTLSSNLTGEPLCPGEIVIFTCETRGSAILAWTSDEYIESDGTRMELATFNDVGDTRTSPINSNTVATLIDKTNEMELMYWYLHFVSEHCQSSWIHQ